MQALAAGARPYAEARAFNVALVGETAHDVREVMIDGPAGLLRMSPFASARNGRRREAASNGETARRLTPSRPGSRAAARAAARRRLVRRTRHGEAPDATFDMLNSACAWSTPRQLITATPRPIALIKWLVADPRTALTRAGTRADKGPLARLPGRDRGALCRHAARPAGDRRRDHRGASRRAVDARDDRAGAR